MTVPRSLTALRGELAGAAANTRRKLMAERRYRRGGGAVPSDLPQSAHAALAWLCRAQDATGVGGFARAYSLVSGWERPYPETTGYIVSTLLRLAGEAPDLDLAARARRAGCWLAEVQLESGATVSKQWYPGNTTPSVFNTGMVLHGYISLLERGPEPRIEEAARRAAEWLRREQDDDGAWRRNAFNGIPHTYYTMAAWALARYSVLAGDASSRTAAARQLDWTLANQRDNGWFEHNAFHPGDPVTTHTLSYTTQGLAESGILLSEERYLDAARRGTEPLRAHFDRTGTLPGTFDSSWSPTASWECVTGAAQASIVWQLLARARQEAAWRQAASRLNEGIMATQRVGSADSGIEGAIPGSWPLSGRYDTYAFPNHAAKFYLDAICPAASAEPAR